MNDLDKILGSKKIILSKDQQDLLDHYIDYRSEFRTSNTHDLKTKTEIANHLNSFYNSLSRLQKIDSKAWFTYETCNIDEMLVTSLKIAEFTKENNLESNLMLSDDSSKFLFVMGSEKEAKDIRHKLQERYNGIVCKMIEITS